MAFFPSNRERESDEKGRENERKEHTSAFYSRFPFAQFISFFFISYLRANVFCVNVSSFQTSFARIFLFGVNSFVAKVPVISRFVWFVKMQQSSRIFVLKEKNENGKLESLH